MIGKIKLDLLCIGLIALSWWASFSCSHEEEKTRGERNDRQKERLEIYEKAQKSLIEEGNRKKAAALFDELSQKYPAGSSSCKEFQELASLLSKMAEEDAVWREPDDISKLSVDEQISYYVYKLRDVKYELESSRPSCQVVFLLTEEEIRYVKEKRQVSLKLQEIGEPAIDTLINLLNDRRPIRSLFWPSHFIMFEPTPRSIMRYQDESFRILMAIKPELKNLFPKGEIACFSDCPIEYQRQIIDEIQTYLQR